MTTMTLQVEQVIGKLKILNVDNPNKIQVQCECGIIKHLTTHSLLDKGRNKSCNKGKCSPSYKEINGVVNGLMACEDKDNCNIITLTCKCGRVFKRPRDSVQAQKIKSCSIGLCNEKVSDLTGKNFGHLIVKSLSGFKKTSAHWLCLCICGKEAVIAATNLVNHQTRSCGCLKQKMAAQLRTRPARELTHDYVFTKYRSRALNANLEFSLNKDEFSKLLDGDCFYCGVPPKNVFIPRRRLDPIEINYSGVDKIIPALGYRKGNCVSCCKDCNFAKNNLSQEEFLNLVRKIASRFPI